MKGGMKLAFEFDGQTLTGTCEGQPRDEAHRKSTGHFRAGVEGGEGGLEGRGARGGRGARTARAVTVGEGGGGGDAAGEEGGRRKRKEKAMGREERGVGAGRRTCGDLCYAGRTDMSEGYQRVGLEGRGVAQLTCICRSVSLSLALSLSLLSSLFSFSSLFTLSRALSRSLARSAGWCSQSARRRR
eukprot:1114326-Rhodomonas_salina.1